MIHLGIQRPLGQRLLQLIDEAIGVERRPGVGASSS
jgi:hypothetical protein